MEMKAVLNAYLEVDLLQELERKAYEKKISKSALVALYIERGLRSEEG